VVVANNPKLFRARVGIGAPALLGCDQIAIVPRVLPLVLSRIDFAKIVGRALALAEKKAAALVRVSLLAVPFDLSEMF